MTVIDLGDMPMFLGREKELESLGLLLKKPTASLVACRGRRRIGKSTLFKEFARRNKIELIVIEGLGPRKGQTNADQLKNFGERLCAQTRGARVVPDSWMEAFKLLGERIDDRYKTVVLLDEISWMGRHEPDFPGFLKNGWDDELKQHGNLILVLCGSVSAWIQDNLLESATFGGRFSRNIVLRELPLDLCVKFWRGREARIAPREIIDVLSVTGGVPRYLEEINPSLSADENIRRMCFAEDGPLFKDFNAIFSEVFGGTSLAKADILRNLSIGPATCTELADRLGVERGGSLSRNLEELCEAGFAAKDDNINPATGRRARLARYRVGDNYTRFFLKYIEPHEEEIRHGRYGFGSLSGLPGWEADKGFQFENLVVNHAMALMPYLNLEGVTVRSAAPFLLKGKKGGQKGVQIDLLIQTAKVAYLVEVKRRSHIGREIEQEMSDKVAAFPKKRGVSVRTALVYDGELAEAVARDGVFDVIVPFARLLGLP
ncbi:MAG: ATP-binding protein [Kiritimatiellae bacterium]|nr:ATP-binding protein [Kiritimatiellia bacterium]